MWMYHFELEKEKWCMCFVSPILGTGEVWDNHRCTKER